MKFAKFGLTAMMAVAAMVVTVAMVGQARAAVVFNEDVPIVGSVTNPCNGETVVLSGSGHEVDRITVNGNTFHIGVHFDAGGVSGVGQTTGAKYSVSDSFDLKLNLAAGGTATIGENFHLIPQGKTPNFVLHVLFHMTLNANGNPTSSVDNFTTRCK